VKKTKAAASPTLPGGRLIRLCALVSLCASFLACLSIPPHPRPRDYVGVGKDFSGELALAHSQALRGLGPRLPGSESDRIARAYLAREFRRNGAKPRELAGGASTHLIAENRGRSRDVILLVAAYPVLGSGDWVDDTGAGVVLELARAFESTSQPYTLGFALAETRPSRATTEAGIIPTPSQGEDLTALWEPVTDQRAARRLVVEAGRELAIAIEAAGEPDRIRAIIVLDLSGHRDLRIVRDLHSHPGFRKIFWRSAARLGQDSIFPSDESWDAPGSLHLGFQERSMNRILALVDIAPREDELAVSAPTRSRPTRSDLEAFGRVVVEALGTLMRRFEKVDAFSR